MYFTTISYSDIRYGICGIFGKLLIIFMLMSCFGGCGYYRQRRLALMSRSSSLTRPDPVLPATCHRSTRRSRSQEGSRQFNFFAYNGPGFNGPEPVSNLPPAYYEVLNQPNLYPANKIELPPYPGIIKTGEDSQLVYSSQRQTVVPSLDASLPPPYTESYCNSSLLPFSQSQSSYHQAFNSDLQLMLIICASYFGVFFFGSVFFFLVSPDALKSFMWGNNGTDFFYFYFAFENIVSNQTFCRY
ncbi:hypothetical protein Btru_010089 [Bulinus truncatus]|nr:hypothetical protein Btru_010089 [Bulinus truncatus]